MFDYRKLQRACSHFNLDYCKVRSEIITNKTNLNRQLETLADQFDNQESKDYFLELIKILDKGSFCSFCEFVKTKGLRTKIDSGIFSYIKQGFEDQFEIKEELLYLDDICNDLLGVGKFKRLNTAKPSDKRKFIDKCVEVLEVLDKNAQWDDQGNLYTYIPISSTMYRISGKPSAGAQIDYRQILSFLSRLGFITLHRPSIAPTFKIVGKDVVYDHSQARCTQYKWNRDLYNSLRSKKWIYNLWTPINELDCNKVWNNLNKKTGYKETQWIIWSIMSIYPLTEHYVESKRMLKFVYDKHYEWYGKTDQDRWLDASTRIPQYHAVIALMEKDFSRLMKCTADDYSGRFHSIITNLSKSFRKFCTDRNGVPLVELDIQACQPTLLINQYEEETGKRCKFFDHKFKDLYEFIARRMHELRGLDFYWDSEVRSEFKVLMMRWMYTRFPINYYIELCDFEILNLNKAIFSIDQDFCIWVESHKDGINPSELPKKMQKREIFIFRKIWDQLQRSVSCKFSSVHDSIKLSLEDSIICQEIMYKIIKKYNIKLLGNINI